jgi:hypothetical protein
VLHSEFNAVCASSGASIFAPTTLNVTASCEVLILVAAGCMHLTSSAQRSHFVLADVKHELRSLIFTRTSLHAAIYGHHYSCVVVVVVLVGASAGLCGAGTQ